MLDKKKVPNMDKLHSIHPNEGYILTTPVGDSQPPETGQAAYTAIVCVLESLKVVVFLIYGQYLTIGSGNARNTGTCLPQGYP